MISATGIEVDTTETDGRTRRRTRNTDAVVDALLDLLRAGIERPSAAEIAKRAGVSERTVFRHFDDLDSLLAIAVEHQLAQLAPWLDAPAPEGPVAARIAAVVEHRAEIFELITPVRRVVLRTATARPAVLVGPAEVDRRLRAHVARAFAPELSAGSSSARVVLRHALEVSTSWPHWHAMRSDLRLDVRTSKQVLARTLTALVGT